MIELLLASQLVLVEKQTNEIVFNCSRKELMEVLRYHYPEPQPFITSAPFYSTGCPAGLAISSSVNGLPPASSKELKSIGECLLKAAEDRKKTEEEASRIKILAQKCLGDTTETTSEAIVRSKCYQLGDLEFCPDDIK